MVEVKRRKKKRENGIEGRRKRRKLGFPRWLPQKMVCAERVTRKTFRREGRRKTGYSEVAAAKGVLRSAGHQKNLSEFS
jgi:hypothetical protein